MKILTIAAIDGDDAMWYFSFDAPDRDIGAERQAFLKHSSSSPLDPPLIR